MEFLLLYANVQTPSALIYLLIVREPDIVSLTSTFICMEYKSIVLS